MQDVEHNDPHKAASDQLEPGKLMEPCRDAVEIDGRRDGGHRE